MNQQRDTVPGNQHFAPTHWSMVLRAVGDPAADHDSQQKEALNNFCRIYWTPVYAWLRRSGQNAHDAQDLTQSFFAKLLQSDSLKSIKQEKGSFRSYLLGALKNHVIDVHRHTTAGKRGGSFLEERTVQIDDAEAWLAGEDQAATPEAAYDRRWATSLIGEASQQLRDQFVKADKEKLYAAIHPYLFGHDRLESYETIAKRVGVNTATITMAVKRMRDRFGELLTREVALTLPPGGDVTEEIRYLFSLFTKN